MSLMNKYYDKYLFMFEPAEVFCTSVNSSFTETVDLIKFWIKLCVCFIGKVIICSKNDFVFFLCCRFNRRTFSINVLVLLICFTKARLLLLFLCSLDCEWDLICARFIILLHC